MVKQADGPTNDGREPGSMDERAARDERMMAMALAEARRCVAWGDVPVGAVVAREGEVLAAAGNQREHLQDPTAHAEIVAIRAAAAATGSWRLEGCTLYATLEPCAMCAGALVLARAERLVFAAHDPKAGFAGSLGDLVRDPRLDHRGGRPGGRPSGRGRRAPSIVLRREALSDAAIRPGRRGHLPPHPWIHFVSRCEWSAPTRPWRASAPAIRSTSRPPPPHHQCCWMPSSREPLSWRASSSSTCTAKGRRRTWRRRWTGTCATTRSSLARTRGRRSTRAGPITSPSSSRTSPSSSRGAAARRRLHQCLSARRARILFARDLGRCRPWRPCAPRCRGDRAAQRAHATHLRRWRSSTSTTSTTAWSATCRRLPRRPTSTATSEVRIARRIAELVPDGATLQMGIGGHARPRSPPRAGRQARPRHPYRDVHRRRRRSGRARRRHGRAKELHRGKIVADFVDRRRAALRLRRRQPAGRDARCRLHERPGGHPAVLAR